MSSEAKIREAIDDWVKHNLPSISPRGPAAIHMDELASLVGNQDANLDFVWRGYILLVEIVTKQKLLEYMPSLVLFLNDSPELDTTVPEWGQVVDQLSRQPPCLYLSLRLSKQRVKNFESYRAPMRGSSMFSPVLDGIFFFYDCCRDEEARRWGWEYMRMVNVEQYPPEYRTS